ADLSTVADRMRDTARFLNTSNTGSHLQTATALASAPAAAWHGYQTGGLPGALAGAVGGALLPYAPSWLAARATTSPLLTRYLAAPPAMAEPGARFLSGLAAYPREMLPLLSQ